MPTTKPPYPAEFKQQMVELVRAGRTPAELGREFKCSAQSISTWVARDAADRRAPQRANRMREHDVLNSAEREELARLRRENRQLKLERDILAKATAWFAGKDGKMSIGSTNS
jgi:transposase